MSSPVPPSSPSIPSSSISTTYPLPCTYPEETQVGLLSPKPLHLGLGLGLGPPRVPIRPSISPLGGPRRTQSDTRGPPLGDPSLEYMDPGSDFIRLRSAHKRSASSRCVVTLGPKKVAEREGIGEEEESDYTGNGSKTGKNCLLTNGVLPLIQTDRLAFESIVPTYIKSKSINPGGANAASGYTLQLTNPLNSTDIYATSEPFEIKPPNSAYPAQDDTTSASAPASGSGSTSEDPSSPSSTSIDKPNGASHLDLVGARNGVILGFVAFGGMMYLVRDDLMPGLPGHPFGFGP